MGYNIKKYTIKLGRKNSAQPLKHSPFAGPHLEDLHLLFTLLLVPWEHQFLPSEVERFQTTRHPHVQFRKQARSVGLCTQLLGERSKRKCNQMPQGGKKEDMQDHPRKLLRLSSSTNFRKRFFLIAEHMGGGGLAHYSFFPNGLTIWWLKKVRKQTWALRIGQYGMSSR